MWIFQTHRRRRSWPSRAEWRRPNSTAARPALRRTLRPSANPDLTKLNSKKDWLPIYRNIVGEIAKPIHNAQPIINKEALSHFLGELEYPLYFLDYETMSGLIPYFDGHRPYQQVPFQYSLHILESPEAAITQKEYLHRDNSDPSRPLTEQLLKDIGNKGSVLVWFEGFEKVVIVN